MPSAKLAEKINQAVKHHPFCEHVTALAEHAENLERQIENGLVDGVFWREKYGRLLRAIQENSERIKAALKDPVEPKS